MSAFAVVAVELVSGAVAVVSRSDVRALLLVCGARVVVAADVVVTLVPEPVVVAM